MTENLNEQTGRAIGRGSGLAPAVLAAPARRGYASLAGLDGNTWVIQKIRYRPPRGSSGGQRLD